jgi:hypothetical protein
MAKNSRGRPSKILFTIRFQDVSDYLNVPVRTLYRMKERGHLSVEGSLEEFLDCLLRLRFEKKLKELL